jgi:Fur family ferric uptake transcriptional regulator
LYLHVPLYFFDQIAIKPDDQPTPIRGFAFPFAEIIHIVPAVIAKQVGYNRRAKQESYLIAGHSRFYCLDILRLKLVTLLHVNLVHAGIQCAQQKCQGKISPDRCVYKIQEKYPLSLIGLLVASGKLKDNPSIANSLPDQRGHSNRNLHRDLSGLSEQNKSQDLRAAGLKATAARIRVLQLLEQSPSRHLSAEEVYKLLLGAGEEIGLATVYRVLSQFEAAGLVTRHNFEEGFSVFERSSGDHHDHMVCLDSGKVIEFMDEEIEQLQHAIAAKHGYEIVNHNLVLFVKPKAK